MSNLPNSTQIVSSEARSQFQAFCLTLEPAAVLYCPGFYIAPSSKGMDIECTSLCDPMDGSPPGPAVPGVLQARVLEWVAIAFSVAFPLAYYNSELTTSTASSISLEDGKDIFNQRVHWSKEKISAVVLIIALYFQNM